MMNLIIFSHTDYSYLWPIIEEYIVPLKELNPIFVSNYHSNLNIEKPQGFTKYIEYDPYLCYSQRWIKILQEIDSEYILVVHDVCIIVNCNVQRIMELGNIIKNNNVDRCSMNIFDGIDIIHDKISICNLNNNVRGNTFVPFDLCPAIWNLKSFLNLWLQFPNETYRQSELNHDLQNFCKNLKCYGLQKNENEKIFYCLGRPYADFFKILHITIQGELTYPKHVYMDAMDYFNQINEKYKLEEKVRINNNYNSILENFREI